MISSSADRPQSEPGRVAEHLAANTVLQAAGEAASRVLALAFYAVLARRLGAGGLGEFTFALAVIGLMLLADTAIDDVVARDVASAGSAAPRRTGDALVAKLAVGSAVGAGAIIFTLAGDYSWTTRGVVCLMVIGALPELGITTLYAALRGLGDFRTGTIGLLFMRLMRAGLGIGVLLAGGRVLAAAGTYAAGGLIAVAITIALVRTRADRPRVAFSKGATARILRRSWRLAAAGALDTLLVSIGPIALSLASGAAAVGAYGAGLRLALVTQFVSIALAMAALPVLARSSRTSTPRLGQVVESTLKAATALALPVTAFLALFAAPVVHAVYGHGYAAAVTPTRLFAGIVIMRAVTVVMWVALLAHDRLVLLLRIPLAVLFLQVALLGALIPTQGVDGAAIALLISEAAYAALLTAGTLKLAGPLALFRIASGPLAGVIVMSIAAVAIGANAAGIAAALIGYGATLLIWERIAFPSDLTQVRKLAFQPAQSWRHAAVRGTQPAVGPPGT